MYENGYVSILKGTWKIRVHKASDIPITYGGKAVHNIMNTLPAVLAAYLYRNITIEDIKQAILTFIPSPTQTPGRLNLFQFKRFKLMLDFAHNPAGLSLLCDFLNKMDATHRVAIISGTGDRRDNDIRDLGRIAAQNFDKIIISQDNSLRGRTADEIVNLLIEGINENKPENLSVTVILSEKEAIMHAYTNAKPGSLVTLLADHVDESLEFVKKLQEEEDKA
ncbi:MAG: cyanophycin synthetase [Segetibacter sp.]